MHELPVTQNILEIALRHAEQANAVSVSHIYLVIGDLSSIVDDSIQFYWGMIAKDSMAENARLHFKRISAKMQCMVCFEEFAPEKGELLCPHCGGVGAKILAGEEFFVEAIEIETNESHGEPQ